MLLLVGVVVSGSGFGVVSTCGQLGLYIGEQSSPEVTECPLGTDLYFTIHLSSMAGLQTCLYLPMILDINSKLYFNQISVKSGYDKQAHSLD